MQAYYRVLQTYYRVLQHYLTRITNTRKARKNIASRKSEYSN